MVEVLVISLQKISLDGARKVVLVMGNSYTYTVKKAERVKTAIGPRIKCPYCHLLFKEEDLRVHGGSAQDTNPCCKKVFVMPTDG